MTLEELLYYAREDGFRQGIEQGIEQGRVRIAAALMQSQGWDAATALEALEVPDDDLPRYLEMLDGMRAEQATEP